MSCILEDMSKRLESTVQHNVEEELKHGKQNFSDIIHPFSTFVELEGKKNSELQTALDEAKLLIKEIRSMI